MGPLVSSKTEDQNLEDGKLSPNGKDKYIGVYLPQEVQVNEDSKLVYSDKTEAFKFIRKYKKARFKMFSNVRDALIFSKIGCEPTASDSPQAVPEKSSPFKAPKPQELVKFRKSIVEGNMDQIKELIETNPRYLVSSGDTPAILHEGPRYNALHIAARSGNAAVTEYILDTISDSEFIRKLYADSSIDPDQCIERSEKLIDLYLNTPDKALNETPLHFAVKTGALDVIKILISYPSCDKTRLNKFKQSPKDVICSRVSVCDESLYNEISLLLDDQFFVPVLVQDNNLNAGSFVGEPVVLTSPETEEALRSPSPVKVKAWAGPMSEETAFSFRKLWKTSPERKTIIRQSSMYDPDKGLETVGRNLAQMKNVRWVEYWEFLNAFVDLRTPQGLDLLEKYLENKHRSQMADTVKNHEVKNHTKSRHIDQKSADDDPQEGPQKSPISDLCQEFNKLRIRSPTSPEMDNKENGTLFTNLKMDKICLVFAKRISAAILRNYEEGTIKEITHLKEFLQSCSNDAKFRGIQMKNIHAKTAEMVARRFVTLKEKNQAEKTINQILRQSVRSSDVNQTLGCVLSKVLDFLNDSEEILENDSCDCKIAYCTLRKFYRPRKIDFHPEDSSPDPKSPDEDHDCASTSDSSDEDMFLEATESAISGETVDEDADFSDVSILPEVYLTNNDYPTKTDAEVLEVIGSLSIDRAAYPYIDYWKHLCKDFALHVKKENWANPPCSTKNETAETRFSPSWHRSKTLRMNFDYVSDAMGII